MLAVPHTSVPADTGKTFFGPGAPGVLSQPESQTFSAKLHCAWMRRGSARERERPALALLLALAARARPELAAAVSAAASRCCAFATPAGDFDLAPLGAVRIVSREASSAGRTSSAGHERSLLLAR